MTSAFQQDAFQNDAFQIEGGAFTFTIDAVLRKSQTGSFTIDAFIAGAFAFTADAIIRAERVGSVTADAVVSRAQSASFTANAVLRRERSGSFTANSTLRRTQQASFTADAYLAYHIESSFTANSVLKRTMTGSFVARAMIAVPGESGTHIRVGGVDITDDVIFSGATFTTFVNGTVGSFNFRVKDTDRTREFTSGAEVTLDIDGVRRFGGYLMQPMRTFFFPVEDTVTDITRVTRALVLQGVDYNILFDKRVVYHKDTPSKVALRSWPEDTEDRTIIRYVVDNYTDLYEDGVTTDKVEHVGFPNPDHRGVVGSGGLRFGDLMRETNRLIGAVWYFDPYKDLVWTDVDTPNASKSLSDDPAGGTEIGFRDFSHVENGTKLANDAMVWGAAQGVARLAFAREQDASSIAAHGRWQYGEFTTQLYKQASVDLRAATIVDGTPQNKRGGKDDQVSWMVKTRDKAFVIGQKVAIESVVWGVSDVVPIRKMTITFPTRDEPLFDMVLSHEIDEPWNNFEFVFPRFPPISFPPFDPEVIVIVDPFPECWWETGGPLDDFTRSVLTRQMDWESNWSIVGFTSHKGYTWHTDDEDEGFFGGINVVLDGGLRYFPDTETDNWPNSAEWEPGQSFAEHFVFIPIDGDDFRITFNVQLGSPPEWPDPWIDPVTGLPEFTGDEDGQFNFLDCTVRRADGFEFHGNGVYLSEQAIASFRLIDTAGEHPGGDAGLPDGVDPHAGSFVETGDDTSVGDPDAWFHDLGAQGAFANAGVIFERHGDTISLIVGSLTHSWTVTSPIELEPGEGYIKLEFVWGFLNTSLEWFGEGESDHADYKQWFVANSNFFGRISNLRLESTKGTCVNVPPYARFPHEIWNGPVV